MTQESKSIYGQTADLITQGGMPNDFQLDAIDLFNDGKKTRLAPGDFEGMLYHDGLDGSISEIMKTAEFLRPCISRVPTRWRKQKLFLRAYWRTTM